MRWIRVTEELPPEGQVVTTMIKDEKGCHDFDELCCINGDWYFPIAGNRHYAKISYRYTPTHWLNMEPEDCCCDIFPRTEE